MLVTAFLPAIVYWLSRQITEVGVTRRSPMPSEFRADVPILDGTMAAPSSHVNERKK